MASEDSDQLSSRLPTIHRFRYHGDLNETGPREMTPAIDHPYALRKPFKVLPLRRTKRMGLKERNDRRYEVFSTVDDVLSHVLSVIVMTTIGVNTADAEKGPQTLQAPATAFALRHHELMHHLIAGCVAGSPRPAGLPNEANREASFSVYKTNNPAELNQPFLLVFCTRHIVTIPSA